MIWLGVLFLVLAFGLIIGELFTGSGLLLASGIAAAILGVVILFTQGSVVSQINWWLAAPVIILFMGFVTFVVMRVINIHLQKAKTGKEDMVGNTAIVKRTLDPEGIVLFEGELWEATSSSGEIKAGEEVIITRVDRLRLEVTKKEKK